MAELDAGVVVALLLLLLAGLLVRHAVRRSARRISSSVARAADLRDYLAPPGARRDVLVLRKRLAAEIRATGDMLRSAPQGLVFRADAQALVHDIESTATSLLGELAAIEGFRDIAQQRSALEHIRPQVEQLIETTYRARQIILRTAAEDRGSELERLRACVDQQEAALELYRRGGGSLSA